MTVFVRGALAGAAYCGGILLMIWCLAKAVGGGRIPVTWWLSWKRLRGYRTFEKTTAAGVCRAAVKGQGQTVPDMLIGDGWTEER